MFMVSAPGQFHLRGARKLQKTIPSYQNNHPPAKENIPKYGKRNEYRERRHRQLNANQRQQNSGGDKYDLNLNPIRMIGCREAQSLPVKIETVRTNWKSLDIRPYSSENQKFT
ncbi:MAG: hypothetical protein EZS28_013574 [Streblomastix strix]|uniref:Uncharacterized protein n=1 Tax=Streblomastix strix TaxID=222440 RepID=A0A5J4W7R7_9EUKA|nr:MAG: hypothetical protein EZS28_013574 [Streblomastix strix]